MRSLSHRLLKENDLSYGIYIYHLVVINVWVEHQWRGTVWHALSIAAVVVALSSASWWLLERPMLRLKKKSLRQV
jgi:peptidoglycan/LPS O-acetylase OafA/YrhL